MSNIYNSSLYFVFDVLGAHRFATSEIICKACDTLQGVSNLCIQCGVQFGGYFCGICKLWKADDAVGTFHCDG